MIEPRQVGVVSNAEQHLPLVYLTVPPLSAFSISHRTGLVFFPFHFPSQTTRFPFVRQRSGCPPGSQTRIPLFHVSSNRPRSPRLGSRSYQLVSFSRLAQLHHYPQKPSGRQNDDSLTLARAATEGTSILARIALVHIPQLRHSPQHSCYPPHPTPRTRKQPAPCSPRARMIRGKLSMLYDCHSNFMRTPFSRLGLASYRLGLARARFPILQNTKNNSNDLHDLRPRLASPRPLSLPGFLLSRPNPATP